MTEIIEKRNKKSDQFNCRSQNLSTETKELPASSLISDEASSGIEITKIESNIFINQSSGQSSEQKYRHLSLTEKKEKNKEHKRRKKIFL